MSDRIVVVGMRELRADVARAANALERIASWLESVQLVDPIGERIDDGEPTNPEDWEGYAQPAPARTLTRAEADREQAEALWAEVKDGDRLRIYWDDGRESVWIVGAPQTPIDPPTPLYPQVVRMVRA